MAGQASEDRLVLVVSDSFDPHVDFVATEFERRGIPWIRFNLQDFPLRVSISLDVQDGEARVSFRFGERLVRAEEIRSIWYRRTAPFALPEELDEVSTRTAKAECRAFIHSVWKVLEHKPWVSHPHTTRAAGHKAEQLIRAQTFGFSIPASLFTNSAQDAEAFYQARGGEGSVIYKPHSSIMVPLERMGNVGVVYTSLLNDGHMAKVQEIRATPGIFQPYVEKDFEVRVTVMGEQVFACAIYSQEGDQQSENAKIDWRNWRWDLGPSSISRHEVLEVDAVKRNDILDLVKSYGLSYAAIDFIVTPSGDWVFLELNPNGQWAWIEEMTGAPMAAALVDVLAGHEASTNQ